MPVVVLFIIFVLSPDSSGLQEVHILSAYTQYSHPEIFLHDTGYLSAHIGSQIPSGHCYPA